MPEQENKMPNGWKDVTITVAMPLDVLVNFLNVLNQRLCTIENVVTVQGPEGKMISITDLYAIQSAEEMKKQAEAQKALSEKTDTPAQGA